jgi:hypothetical protein
MTNKPIEEQQDIKVPESWTKPPKLRELKQDQQEARAIHTGRVEKISAWLDNMNMTGKASLKLPANQSTIQPKLIRKQAEWRYAALSEPFLSTTDVFNVNPVTWEDKNAARQNELLLNYQLNTQIDKIRFIDEYVRTAVDEGTVIVQLGWEFQEETYEELVPDFEFVVNPQLAELHQQLAEMKQLSPSQFQTDIPDELKQAHEMSVQSGQPIEPVNLGTATMQTKTKTIVNRPTLEVCDYRNIMIDPTAQGDIDKANFIIKSYETSKYLLKKDGKKYQNLDKINIDNVSVLASPDHSAREAEQNFNFKDDARKKFVVYQYWGKVDVDGSGNVTSIVAEWVGDVLIRMEESPFPDKKLPFILEHYLPVRKDNYGEPDGALLEDNQKVIGAVTRGMIDILGKSANGQTGIRKDMLDSVNRKKFESGKDYEFNSNVDPRQGVHMHVFPEIPNSAQFMLQVQNMEAESMTGVKSWAQGMSSSALGDVAVGIRGALDAASKRELGILRRLSNGIIKMGRKLISMNAVFLSEEEVIRVTNEQFVTIRRDDLPGNFDLTLTISTAEEDNNKAEQLAFMLQTVGPNMDPELSKIILSDIARLRKMPDLAQKIINFQPQPDPYQEQMKQLEMMKLQADIELLKSKAQENLADIGLKSSKAGTEVVKQGHLKSDTDLKNLEFLEQESGVKQAREKELHGVKASADLTKQQNDLAYKESKDNKDFLKEYLTNKDKD